MDSDQVLVKYLPRTKGRLTGQLEDISFAFLQSDINPLAHVLHSLSELAVVPLLEEVLVEIDLGGCSLLYVEVNVLL